MKKLFFFLGIICNSCIIEYDTSTEFIYENKTDYTISMEMIMPRLHDTIFIDTYNIDSHSEKSISCNGSGLNVLYNFLYLYDSVVFSIGDSVSKTFLKDDISEYNPLNLDNYILSKKSGKRYDYFKYTYTFTNDNISKILGQ